MDSDRIKELEFLAGVTLRLESEINLLKSWIKSQCVWDQQNQQNQNQNQNQPNQLILIPVINTFPITNKSDKVMGMGMGMGNISSTNTASFITSTSQEKSTISQDDNNNNDGKKCSEKSEESFILKSLLNKGKSEPIRIQPKPAILPNEYDDTDDTIEILCDTRSDKMMGMGMTNISSTNCITTTGSQVISFGDKNSNSSLINQPITFTQTLMTIPETIPDANYPEPDTDPLANCDQNKISSSSVSHTSNTNANINANTNLQIKPKTPKIKKNITSLKNPTNLSLTLNGKTTGTEEVREPGIKSNVQQQHNNQFLKKTTNYKCMYCSKTFCTFSQKKRARHIRLCQRTTQQQLMHLPFKFKCEEPGCNMNYKKLETLQRHHQVDHVGLKCQFCPEIMYSCKRLYRHVEDVHFICGIKNCYKKSLTKAGLVFHKKKKHPNKRNHFVHFKSQFIGTEKITIT